MKQMNRVERLKLEDTNQEDIQLIIQHKPIKSKSMLLRVILLQKLTSNQLPMNLMSEKVSLELLELVIPLKEVLIIEVIQ